MPSLQEKLAQTSDPLTLAERNHIRSRLGIPNESSASLFQQTEQRMISFGAELVREAKALYKAIDRLGDSTARLINRGGIHAAKADDRAKLIRELRNLILPADEMRPSEAIGATGFEEGDDKDELSFVPVRFSSGGDDDGAEFSS